MSTPLLATKFYIPRTRPELVPRPRLIERLDQGRRCTLTLLSAPAGFGKTTLLAEWIAHLQPSPPTSAAFSAQPAPVQNHKSKIQDRIAWLSLDEDDDDPARFLAYLAGALRTLVPGLGLDAHETRPAAFQPALAVLINELAALPDRLLLVLDDYHLITDAPIHRAMGFLLDHLPPNMHLVIASRTDPPLPLARLRVRGQMSELREADLRFTPDEVTAFLNQVMGFNLSPGDMAALEARTEGWIAGLQLAALSMRDRDDAAGFVQAFSGSHRYVLDYLTDEVLQRQAEAVQEFLLQTSILEQLSGPLCDAVNRGRWRSPPDLDPHLERRQPLSSCRSTTGGSGIAITPSLPIFCKRTCSGWTPDRCPSCTAGPPPGIKARAGR